MIEIAKTNEAAGLARKASWRGPYIFFMICIVIGIAGVMAVQLLIDFQRFKNWYQETVYTGNRLHDIRINS